MTTSRHQLFAKLAKAAMVGGVLALAAVPVAAQTKINAGRTTGASGFHIPSYIAMEKGFFKREGLDAKYVAMTGKALITAGMGGAIDFVPIPGGGSQAILKGAPIVYVVGQSLISQWAIVVDPKIKTVQDLKGKTIGYGRPGGADYDEGEITLGEFFNMNVGRDYNVISFQGEPERLAGLIAGSIQAALQVIDHISIGHGRLFSLAVVGLERLQNIFRVIKEVQNKGLFARKGPVEAGQRLHAIHTIQLLVHVHGTKLWLVKPRLELVGGDHYVVIVGVEGVAQVPALEAGVDQGAGLAHLLGNHIIRRYAT